MTKKSSTIVIKVGTNVLSHSSGLLDHAQCKNLVKQIAAIQQKGWRVILISSGAVGAGRGVFQFSSAPDDVTERQVLSSIGQVLLMQTYVQLFGSHGITCAQVLVTKEDFRDRQHYLNMKHCIEALVRRDIIPILNENDVISIDELMFTDNDELAGLVATMHNVDTLLLLTSVDGVMIKGEDGKRSRVLEKCTPGDSSWHEYLGEETSRFGRGGMRTKCRIAEKMSSLGITTHIFNGKTPNSITRVVNGEALGTTFLPRRKISSIKKWIASAEGREKGIVVINECAKDALRDETQARSLLPIGIVAMKGKFVKGDVIKIENKKGKTIGFGLAQYSSDVVKNNVGKKGKKPFIHYDQLYLGTA